MKLLLQNLKTGKTEILNTPTPRVKKGHLLIRTNKSLVSPGTEKMLVDFGRASLLSKAKQQPNKVKQVINKARTDGIIPTYEAVNSKLSTPISLGYSNVGSVIATGDEVEGLIQYVKFAGFPVGSDETGLNAFKSTSERTMYADEL